MNTEDHELYRSGVGILLYLTKHSRPDISNPVRELSKTMDAPAPAHLKEMHTHQVCTAPKRFWNKVQTDQESKEMGTESTE